MENSTNVKKAIKKTVEYFKNISPEELEKQLKEFYKDKPDYNPSPFAEKMAESLMQEENLEDEFTFCKDPYCGGKIRKGQRYCGDCGKRWNYNEIS